MLSGVILLVAGVSIGSFIYWRGLQAEANVEADIYAQQEQTKAYQGSVERNVGATGLLMSQAWDGICSLGRPRPLAILIILTAGATAVGFFVASGRAED